MQSVQHMRKKHQKWLRDSGKNITADSSLKNKNISAWLSASLKIRMQMEHLLLWQKHLIGQRVIGQAIHRLLWEFFMRGLGRGLCSLIRTGMNSSCVFHEPPKPKLCVRVVKNGGLRYSALEKHMIVSSRSSPLTKHRIFQRLGASEAPTWFTFTPSITF